MTLPENILAPIARALTAKGYDSLTPVQAAMIEDNTEGRDLLVSAQTGSGKTVAFGMAIAPTLLGEDDRLPPPGAPLALCIAPTRELAMQVQRELTWLYAETGAVTAAGVGGMDQRAERRVLDRGAHIVVGTPGRLRDHITRGALDMSQLRAVVLDEADEMLDLGFREDLEFILDAAPEDRRTLLFSATVPKQIAELAKTFQKNALRITATSSGQQHADIEYKLMSVSASERENAVINTLLWYESTNTIVFASTREAVKHLSARLANRGFAVVTLSGELSQAERTNALQSMRDGRARICVATDVAARGIDLPGLDLVIHADLPMNSETLLHRSGRTGRAGRKGTCVVIAPAHRKRVALSILRGAKIDPENINPPTADEIDARYREQMLSAEMLSNAASEDEAPLVAELLERHAPEAIAAAYIRLQLAARPVPEDVSPSSGDDFNSRERPSRDAFNGGAWFKVSVGRKQRAEPRWLLPMICKAGGVGKSAVGSIRIFETETVFEVAADKVDAFKKAVGKGGTLEKGVYISETEAPAARSNERPQGNRRPTGPSSYDPMAPREDRKARYPKKARSDDFGGGERPAKSWDDKPKTWDDKPRAERPRADKPKFDKDKGKPAWSKPATEGDFFVKKPKVKDHKKKRTE
ncbi:MULTISPECIES: DEAD/DEAH box helicase [unclassified Devosia]|uniref:DEAD/DEAH box helicase n=1 Tax=unclassified Devosia TaxID=196773 RepID=UPI00145E147B|nr:MULTISPECIES: DEAD/DEAH box helicase [unclassified Devosia]MBJ6988854.1 DEAD/DEAH box helicase [Devosia sp. MC521]QMW63666.1 DEAD/DEAH box helicase [Devosia sp. MC521]